MKNETVESESMMLFLYAIIDQGVTKASKIKINDDKEERDYGAGP